MHETGLRMVIRRGRVWTIVLCNVKKPKPDSITIQICKSYGGSKGQEY